ncbi:TPA: hypothetical protein ACHVHO_000712 [Streptococcus suis]
MFETKHGMHGTKEYNTWKGIKKRCYQKSYQHYDRYGGRGIVMCQEWKDDFMAFFKDVGKAPSGEYQLDRIDNNGNYEPNNCRWVTRQENCRNRNFKVGKSGYPGVSQRKNGKFQSFFNVDRNQRICVGTFETANEAHLARVLAIKEFNRKHNESLRIY